MKEIGCRWQIDPFPRLAASVSSRGPRTFVLPVGTVCVAQTPPMGGMKTPMPPRTQLQRGEAAPIRCGPRRLSIHNTPKRSPRSPCYSRSRSRRRRDGPSVVAPSRIQNSPRHTTPSTVARPSNEWTRRIADLIMEPLPTRFPYPSLHSKPNLTLKLDLWA